MFRLGSKNNQKELLGQTIAELRELMGELSFLNDSLKRMVPEHCGDMPGEISGEGGRCSAEDEMAYSVEEPGDVPDLAVVSGNCTEDTQPEIEEQPGEGCGDACGGTAGYAAGIPLECGNCLNDEGVDYITGEENEAAEKEWAVVNYWERKRPWWKLWAFRGRTAGRME